MLAELHTALISPWTLPSTLHLFLSMQSEVKSNLFLFYFFFFNLVLFPFENLVIDCASDSLFNSIQLYIATFGTGKQKRPFILPTYSRPCTREQIRYLCFGICRTVDSFGNNFSPKRIASLSKIVGRGTQKKKRKKSSSIVSNDDNNNKKIVWIIENI